MAGEAAQISLLIESLKSPDRKAIRQAADRLIELAPGAPGLGERLGGLLAEAPAAQRWPIAYVLANIAPLSPPCFEALKETLGHADPDLRWAAAVLLTRLGRSDGAVRAQLLALLKSGTPVQRRMAVYCSREMEGGDLLEPLLGALEDDDPLVRVAAASNLKPAAAAGAAALDRLLRVFIEDPDGRVRHTVALALARLGAHDARVREALEQAGRSGNPQLEKAARAALELLKK